MDRKIGKLSSFLADTKIAYTGNISPKKGRYRVFTQGRFSEIMLTETGKKTEYIVLSLDNDAPHIFWIGNDSVTPEVCEETREVRGLHSFGIFFQCPKG